jgi:hypothetical protein
MGYFDGEGNCMMISSGAADPPIPFSFKQEVPDGIGPATCEFDPQTKKIKKKEREPLPVPAIDPLLPTLAMLDARVKELERKAK